MTNKDPQLSPLVKFLAQSVAPLMMASTLVALAVAVAALAWSAVDGNEWAAVVLMLFGVYWARRLLYPPKRETGGSAPPLVQTLARLQRDEKGQPS